MCRGRVFVFVGGAFLFLEVLHGMTHKPYQMHACVSWHPQVTPSLVRTCFGA